jgi:ParB family chromosome partitioning protein
VGVLALLSEDLGKPVEEVVGLLRRMRKEKRGEAGHNVMASPEAQRVEEVFQALGRMTWESFVQNRLPLLNLPEDLKAALEEGAIPYTAALELKKVKDEALRKALLEEVKAGLSLRELKARVREALRREKAPRPWHREVGERLLRLDLEALPPERRALVERKLKELEELLG